MRWWGCRGGLGLCGRPAKALCRAARRVIFSCFAEAFTLGESCRSTTRGEQCHAGTGHAYTLYKHAQYRQLSRVCLRICKYALEIFRRNEMRHVERPCHVCHDRAHPIGNTPFCHPCMRWQRNGSHVCFCSFLGALCRQKQRFIESCKAARDRVRKHSTRARRWPSDILHAQSICGLHWMAASLPGAESLLGRVRCDARQRTLTWLV